MAFWRKENLSTAIIAVKVGGIMVHSPLQAMGMRGADIHRMST